MQMPDDSRYSDLRRRRFRPIPVRLLVPNVITLLAICAGLTAIRLSNEGRMELAVAAIVFAAVLDGLDGRSLAPNSTVSPTSSILAWRRD
jgi:CDP-diacylglycerol---serine O-phosphatidyltransferase